MRRAMTWVYCEPKSRTTIRETFATTMLMTSARGLADDWVVGLVGLGQLAFAAQSALKWVVSTRRGRHVAFASSKSDARDEEYRDERGFHAGVIECHLPRVEPSVDHAPHRPKKRFFPKRFPADASFTCPRVVR
jgi:hypothetical protein